MWSVSNAADPPRRAARWLLAALGVLLPAAALASDTSVAETLGGGGKAALASAPRIDARSSGAVQVALPENPVTSFHVKLSTPLRHAPAADGKGRLVIAHGAGKLSQLDAAGRLEWSVRVGPDSEASAPVIARDETRWLITQAGEAVGFGADGRELYRESLPGLTETRDVTLVPLAAGGLALSSARQVAELDRRGKLRFLARTREQVRHVLEAGGALLVIGNGGLVLRRDAEGNLVSLAELGGSVNGAAVAPDERRLFALVDDAHLVELDLVTGRRRTLFSDATVPLSSLAVGSRGELRVLSHRSLLGFDHRGIELFRAPLGGGALAGSMDDDSLALVDGAGTTALTLPEAGLLLVKADGAVTEVSGTVCPSPLRPTPVGPRRLALACGSGLVFGVSDKAR
jgi:hypothetical protein